MTFLRASSNIQMWIAPYQKSFWSVRAYLSLFLSLSPFSIFLRQFDAVFSLFLLFFPSILTYILQMDLLSHGFNKTGACACVWCCIIACVMCVCVCVYEWMLDRRAVKWTHSCLSSGVCPCPYRNQLKQRMLIVSKQLKIGVSDRTYDVCYRCSCVCVCNTIILIKVLHG